MSNIVTGITQMWCKTFHRTYPPTLMNSLSVRPFPEKTFVSSHFGFMMHVTHELIPMLASPLSSPAPPMLQTLKHHIRRFVNAVLSQHLPAKFIWKLNLRMYLIMQFEHLPICYHLNTVVVKLQNLRWVRQDVLCYPDMNNCSPSISFLFCSLIEGLLVELWDPAALCRPPLGSGWSFQPLLSRRFNCFLLPPFVRDLLHAGLCLCVCGGVRYGHCITFCWYCWNAEIIAMSLATL